MARLKSLDEPTHEVLSALVHGCSANPSTQTTTATALVLSLWQLRGRAMTEHVPSMLLLNAAEIDRDPIDEFSRSIVHNEEANKPRVVNKWGNDPIRPEQAQRVMADTVAERSSLSPNLTDDPVGIERAQALETRFRDARLAGFGCGHSRGYAQAWNEHFGLLTNDSGELIARLDGAPDRAAFRHHVLEDPHQLRTPIGIGTNLLRVHKSISISGSLTPDLWDENLARGIVELGLPILFLPHTAQEPLMIGNQPALDVLPTLWQTAAGSRATTSLLLPPTGWFDAHANDVRKRLRRLPGNGGYEFAVLQVLHQLGSVCNGIAHFAGGSPEATQAQISALFWDIHTRAFRGITLGVAALAWHCLGFDPGCPRKKALKALRDLRRKGSMSPSEILRSAHLKKDERDLMLKRLLAEDLIQVEGKTVTAATFDEFVDALHARAELPQADNFRALVSGCDEA